MMTKTFCAGEIDKAKVLVIGHDPRLQNSNTQANYALFADYFFKPIPKEQKELAKYKLAEATFSCILYLTSFKYCADQVVLTNLCNNELPRAPKNKTVLIPLEEAKWGVQAIKEILNSSEIEIVFSMSQQVNYWLQELKLYEVDDEYVNNAKPKQKGIESKPQYYESLKNKVFQTICGKKFKVNDKINLFPILHVKNWPLKGRFLAAYKDSYDRIVNQLK